jgi:hypothetical protein
MNTFIFSESDSVRTEIAVAAARLIAEEGLDYHHAKRKAVQQVLGNSKPRGTALPDNQEIEDQLRIYNELFFADTQPARLRHLRLLALELMKTLARFEPWLIGAVLNGTAGEHSDIHLMCFVDSTKDVEIELLNRNIDFEVSEPHAGRHLAAAETVSFMWQGEGVHLSLHEPGDLRSLPKSRDGRALRADAAGVKNLLDSQDLPGSEAAP